MSTILFVMTAVLWVRSLWVADTLQHVSRIVTADGSMRDLKIRGVESNGGVLSVARMSVTGDAWRGSAGWLAPPAGWAVISQPQPSFGFVVRRPPWFGLTRDRGTRLGPKTFVDRDSVSIPCWLLMIITGILPATLVRRAALHVRSRRRVARGLCRACGYDVRASTGRCPECGEAPVSLPAAPLRAG